MNYSKSYLEIFMIGIINALPICLHGFVFQICQDCMKIETVSAGNVHNRSKPMCYSTCFLELTMPGFLIVLYFFQSDYCLIFFQKEHLKSSETLQQQQFFSQSIELSPSHASEVLSVSYDQAIHRSVLSFRIASCLFRLARHLLYTWFHVLLISPI